MGLNLKDLIIKEKTTLEAFSTRVIAIDAYNAIYQFLASIRGPDGLQLMDSQGRGNQPFERSALQECEFPVTGNKASLRL